MSLNVDPTAERIADEIAATLYDSDENVESELDARGDVAVPYVRTVRGVHGTYIAAVYRADAPQPLVLGVDVEHGVGFSAVDLRTTLGTYRLWLELTDGHVVESVRQLTDDYAAQVRRVLGVTA